MSYVDGFVIPIPKKNMKIYREMARLGGRIWKKHGAIDYKECIGDDLKNGLFPKMVKLKKGETVIFSYIVFKSKKHRDLVNKKVMKDPEMNDKKWEKLMPFDVKRMIYGGFEVIVDSQS